MKYLVVYSVTDTYETYVEIDDDSIDPRADIKDYIKDNAWWEEGFDRDLIGRLMGGGIIVEQYYPRGENA